MLKNPKVELNGKKNGAAVDQLTTDQTEITMPEMIVKRDGRVMAFDASQIQNAIERC